MSDSLLLARVRYLRNPSVKRLPAECNRLMLLAHVFHRLRQWLLLQRVNKALDGLVRMWHSL